MLVGRGLFIFEVAASRAGLDLLPVVNWAPVCEGQLAEQSRRGSLQEKAAANCKGVEGRWQVTFWALWLHFLYNSDCGARCGLGDARDIKGLPKAPPLHLNGRAAPEVSPADLHTHPV